jgi:hypothetical protein
MRDFKIIWLLILGFSLFSQASFAQDLSLNKPDFDIVESEKDYEGWTFGADVGASTTWSLNRRYVGIADGHYFGLGGKIGGHTNFKQDIHEWRTSLAWLATFNKIPSIEAWIKSADQLDFQTDYLASLSESWGYFVTVKLNTSVFSGTDRRPADVNYVIEDLDQKQTTLRGKSLSLTKPFLPLYLQESTGFLGKMLNYSYLTWKIYGGPAARQNFADEQRAISEANEEVKVKTLRTTYQLGPILGTTFSGWYFNDKLSYEAGVEALYAIFRFPVLEAHRFAERLNVEIYSALSFKFYSWMALTWDLRAIRLPDILDDFQLQNNVLLTFSYKY